jgi:hypothetical protein
MEDIISLILIEPHESNALYRDAYQSYKEVYHNCMAKGKGIIEEKKMNLKRTENENGSYPLQKFLGGNPIQLDSNNMNSLFSINSDSKLYKG